MLRTLRYLVLSAFVVLACSVVASSALADRSGVRPEVLQVPSGPGSIEGLGEAFEPNPNTGTSSYSVEIAVPPGVAGFEPSLSFGYSSAGGNGELGLGWSFGIPSVQRGTDRGLPEYDADDTIVIRGMGGHGAEDLVQMPDASFRFRIEGAFVRGRQLSDGSWLFVNRGGVRYRFGTSVASTVTDGGARTFAWLLTQQEDSHGNSIAYEYERDATGKPYLVRIVYNDFSPLVRNEVLFEYEARPDALTSYLATFAVTTAQRLRRVVVRHGGRPVRSYDLTYADSDGVSRLSSVTMTGRDGVTRLPTLSLEYASIDPSGMSVTTMNDAPARSLGTTTELDDVDGDALPDLLIMDPSLDGGTYSYYPNLDGRSFGARTLMADTPSVWLSSEDVQLADMDGDGSSDVVARVSNASDGFRYYPGGSSAGFGERVNVVPNQSAGFEDPDVRLVDLNHDRLTDWMRIDPTTGIVFAAFNQSGGTFTSAVVRPTIDAGEVVSFSAGAKLVDCNGDGLMDVAVLRSGSFRCWHARGNGYFASARAVQDAPILSTDEASAAEVRDISGDGLPDVVHVGVSQVRLWLNRGGTSFGTVTTISGTPFRGANTVVRLADMNANGSDDIVWVDATNVASPWKYLDVLSQGAPGLLKRIDNGLGQVMTIEYAGIGVMRGKSRAEGTPWLHRSSVGQTVVSRLVTADGIGPSAVVEFAYADPHFDPLAREFRGFSTSVVLEVGDAEQPTLATERHFDLGETDECRKSLELSRIRRDSTGAIFDRQTTTYGTRQIASSMSGTPVRFAFQLERETELFELGSVPIMTRESWETDDFGNVVVESKFGRVEGENVSIGNDEVITRKTYAQNLSAWILGEISTERTESLDGSRLAETRFFYDGDPLVGLPLHQVQRGDTRRKSTWIRGDEFVDEVRYDHDAFGNVVAQVDARGARRELTYDEEAHTSIVRERTMTSETHWLEWSAEVELADGHLLALTDPNGGTQRFEYDPLERLVSIGHQDDSPEHPTRRFEYRFGVPISSIREEAFADDSNSVVTFHHVDGLGRTVARSARAADGEWAIRDATTYGPRGWARRAANPYLLAAADAPSRVDIESRPGTGHTYDALGRPLVATAADGTSTEARYVPLAVHNYDENDLSQASPHYDTPIRTESDGLGRVVQVNERDGQRTISTTYAYDALDNLVRFTDAAGHSRSFTYDGRSRRTALTDPNAGTWTFSYSDTDELLVRTDPTQRRTSFDYDLLGRVIEERHLVPGSEEIVAARMHYDEQARAHGELSNTQGQLAWAEDEVGSVYYGYDARGRHTGMVRKWRDGTSHRTWTEFDALDRPVHRGFPDDTYLSYAYDVSGRVSGVGPLVANAEYTAWGGLRTMSLGNGLRDVFEFDQRMRVERMRCARDENVVRALRYSYDDASRISRVDDERSGVQGSRRDLSARYTYDDRYRLIRETTDSEETSIGWDDIGNMLAVTSTGPNSGASLSMAYGSTGPNRLDRAGTEDFTYDAAGRMERDGEREIAWDARGRLARVTRGDVVEEYAYDHENRRAEKRTTSRGRTEIVRYLDLDVEIHDGRVVRYAFLDDRRIARLDAVGGGQEVASRDRPHRRIASGAGTHTLPSMDFGGVVGCVAAFVLLRARRRGIGKMFASGLTAVIVLACDPHAGGRGRPIRSVPEDTVFFHDDLAGTPVALSDTEGNSVSEFSVRPFGQERNRWGREERFGFVGNETDSGSGLGDFGLRPYRHDLGVFLAPDPVAVFDAATVLHTPRMLWPYTYSGGDPVNLSDRGGDLLDTIVDIAAIGFDVYMISQEGATTENVLALGADVVGALVPFATGGGIAIRAGRAADRANDARRAAEAADTANDARRVADQANDARRAADAARAARARQRAAERARQRQPGAGQCPPGGCGQGPSGQSCFVEGTPIRVHAEQGFSTRAIESISLGDRVEALGDEACGAENILPATHRRVLLLMPNSDGSGDLIEIELIRTLQWITAVGARTNAVIDLAVDEIGIRGNAIVREIADVPRIQGGGGCVVTGTFVHDNSFLMDLHLTDGSHFRATDLHPFYSVDRRAWTHLRDLHEGERLHTQDGDVFIVKLEAVEGTSQVFNLEVDVQHSYVVGSHGLWAHNANAGNPVCGGGGNGGRRRPYEPPRVESSRRPTMRELADYADQARRNEPSAPSSMRSDDFSGMAIPMGHMNGARMSSENMHEDGNSTRRQDAGRERGDARRPSMAWR